MTTNSSPIIWRDQTLFLLDQRLLPLEEKLVKVENLDDTINAIKSMIVRGAPCIGFTAILGMALWVRGQKSLTLAETKIACEKLISARPTAVNLSFEVNRCFEIIREDLTAGHKSDLIFQHLVDFGLLQIEESHIKNTAMAQIGLNELRNVFGERKLNLMTHCNTGYLACGSLGTALGVISYAYKSGQVNHVVVDETRPYLQGSRLTAFELGKEGIPYSIVVEGAASYLLSHKKVDAIFVGADRIAANGDTANKVGTSTLAVVAKYYNIPFYVVAPLSSFDLSLPSGHEIEIEMRPSDEITQFGGYQVAPFGAEVINPSFDVTDSHLIKGIICEKGFIDPSNSENIFKVVNKA